MHSSGSKLTLSGSLHSAHFCRLFSAFESKRRALPIRNALESGNILILLAVVSARIEYKSIHRSSITLHYALGGNQLFSIPENNIAAATRERRGARQTLYKHQEE